MGPSFCILLLAFSSSPGKAQQLETSPLVLTSLKGPFLLHLGKGDIQHLQLKKTFPCHRGDCQGVTPLVMLAGPPNSQDSTTQSLSTIQSHRDTSKAWPCPITGTIGPWEQLVSFFTGGWIMDIIYQGDTYMASPTVSGLGGLMGSNSLTNPTHSQLSQVVKPRPSTQASLGLCMGLSLDLSWLCCFSVSCPTNWPPASMLDLPCPYKPPWCCRFSAAGPAALLTYSGMGWGPQQPLGLWCWRSTSPRGTWMWEPEVPPASLVIDQSISVGREAAGKAESAVLKLWDGAESGQGSPGRFFLAGQCCPVQLSPPDHLFMHGPSPWRDVPFHMCCGDLQMRWGGLSQCHEPSLQTVYLTRTLLLGSSSLGHEDYQEAPAELAFWGAWGRRKLWFLNLLACSSSNSCERWLLYVRGFYMCAWRGLEEKTSMCKLDVCDPACASLLSSPLVLPLLRCSLWSCWQSRSLQKAAPAPQSLFIHWGWPYVPWQSEWRAPPYSSQPEQEQGRKTLELPAPCC